MITIIDKAKNCGEHGHIKFLLQYVKD